MTIHKIFHDNKQTDMKTQKSWPNQHTLSFKLENISVFKIIKKNYFQVESSVLLWDNSFESKTA